MTMETPQSNPQDLTNSSGLVFKQTFLGLYLGLIIFAPLFIVFILVKYFPGVINLDSFENQIKMILFAGIYGIVAAIYSLYITHKQFLQRILILYTKGSFQPARVESISNVIFKDAFKFRLRLVIKYYLIVIVAALLAFALTYYAIHQFVFGEQYEISTVLYQLGIVAVLIIFIWSYSRYYLTAKLRYVWFAYLNNYGVEGAHMKAVEEMSTLNSITKGNPMLRSMLAQIKNDTLADISGTVVGSAIQSIPSATKIGGDLKNIAGGFAKQYAYDLANYQTLMNNYNLYNSAYKEAFKSDYTINNRL